MKAQTFEIVGPGFLNMWAPSRKWGGAASLLTGADALRLRMGEFLECAAESTVVRAAAGVGADHQGASPSFAYFSETGRGDIVTGGKVPILMHPLYEADTSIIARVAASGAPDADNNGVANDFALGDALSVADCFVTGDAVNQVFRGLRKASTLDGSVRVVGFVTRVFADKIRFVSALR